MDPVLMISGDGHAAPPAVEYRAYVAPAFRSRFDDWLETVTSLGWTKSREEAMRPVSDDSFARMSLDHDLVDRMESVLRGEAAAAAEWDPIVRLAFLESRGVVAEVLFPNAVPLDGNPIRFAASKFSPGEQWAGIEAYNRWIAEFCETGGGRFAGHALVSFTDIPRAIRQVEVAHAHGLRGVMLPGITEDVVPWWDDGYEPFWSACEDLGMVMTVHGGIGIPDYGPLEQWVPEISNRIIFNESTAFAHRPLQFLIWSGILERHPQLTLTLTEQHSDWIPPTLAGMDHSWRSGMLRSEGIREFVPHAPSEYWRRQCYVGASIVSRAEVQMRDEIGADKMMFGIDFPHPEGAWVDTEGYLRAILAGLSISESEVRAFVGETALSVFGFDRELLSPIVDRVGPSIAGLTTPLPEEHEATFRRTDAFRPLTYM